jgi:glycosyltransferase involved in cell wall biosynthesis
MDKKHILVFAGYFLPHIGGYELSLFQLLVGIVKQGYTVTIVTCNTEKAPEFEILEGLQVYRLPSWNIINGTYPVPKPCRSVLHKLRKLSKIKYDIVLTNTRFFITSLIGLLFSYFHKISCIHIEHGSRHTVLSSPIYNSISRIFDHTIGSFITRKADIVISSSNAGKEFLKHLGVKNEILVLPVTGIDTSLFSGSKKKNGALLKKNLGLENSLIIIVVCRLIFAKGVQDLIKAFPTIKEKIPHAKVIIVGDGPYHSHLERIVQPMNHDDVLFLGQKDHLEVADIYAMADILVHPSYSEALIAYPVLEAGMMGIPSVVSDTGGAREVIKDRFNGILFHVGDISELSRKVIELLQNTTLRTDFGNNMKHFVEKNYSLEKIISTFVTVFESLK